MHRPREGNSDARDWIMRRPTKPGVACSNQAGRAKPEERTGTKPGSLAPGSRVAIRRFAVRNPWIDTCDLEQEAALTALEAGRTWQSGGAASLEWYEARAVSLALSRLVAETRAPVSIPKYCGDTWERATQARGVSLVVQAREDGHAEERPELVEVSAQGHESMEDRLDSAKLLRGLHRLLAKESEAARLVLLEEEKPAVVAKRLGESVAKVYAQTARAVRNLRAALCPRTEAA